MLYFEGKGQKSLHAFTLLTRLRKYSFRFRSHLVVQFFLETSARCSKHIEETRAEEAGDPPATQTLNQHLLICAARQKLVR